MTPDGETFVFTRFVEEEETATPRHLEVVTDFFGELREKLPARNGGEGE